MPIILETFILRYDLEGNARKFCPCGPRGENGAKHHSIHLRKTRNLH